MTVRRAVMAVVGAGTPLDDDLERLCLELGERAIDAGFRLATGGMGGVMAAVSRGAHRSRRYHEGDVVGILPQRDGASANEWVDVAIVTGMGIARNAVLVSTADVVVAVSGGSGTLSEIAFAWQLGKPIVALACGQDDWSSRLAGTALDGRDREPIARACSAAEAVALAERLVAAG